MSAELVERRGRDRQFLEQLLDTSKIENYTVPIEIRADLRKYQQVRLTPLVQPVESQANLIPHYLNPG